MLDVASLGSLSASFGSVFARSAFSSWLASRRLGSTVGACAFAALHLTGCGEGTTVTLGRGSVSADLVSHLASSEDDENPSLTADLLEIYFTSDRDGGAGDYDLYVARRASVEEPFGEPVNVSELSSEEFESSPAVSADGLTLWFGSDREGGVGGNDVWVARRDSRDDAWGEPENVAELNTAADEIPRPLGAGGTTMPLGRREEGGRYFTYLARRSGPDEPFSEPELIESLIEPDVIAVTDAWLSGSGDELWYVRGVEGEKGDIYVARREGEGEFVNVGPARVNTDADERDPWLNADGTRLFFSSDREGSLDIYELRLPR